MTYFGEGYHGFAPWPLLFFLLASSQKIEPIEAAGGVVGVLPSNDMLESNLWTEAWDIEGLSMGVMWSGAVSGPEGQGGAVEPWSGLEAALISKGKSTTPLYSHANYAGAIDFNQNFHEKLAPHDRTENFALRFSGYIYLTQNGAWTFKTNSDDGSMLWINNKKVVNNDGLHAPQVREGTYEATSGPGYYPITFTFYEKGGGEVLIVKYHNVDAGIIDQTLTGSVLFHDPWRGNNAKALYNTLALGQRPSAIGSTWENLCSAGCPSTGDIFDWCPDTGAKQFFQFFDAPKSDTLCSIRGVVIVGNMCYTCQ